MINKIKILFFVLMLPIGAIAFIYAGIDDSPGGQLIGVVVFIIGIGKIILFIKNRKKR